MENPMSETLNKMTNEMLSFHKEAVNWSIEQSKLAEKQMNSAFDTARASSRITRDLTQNTVKSMTAAALPADEQA